MERKAVLAVIVLHYLEKALKKVVPEILQVILVPGISLIVMLPITLVVVGPIGIYIGYAIQWLYTALYSFSPLLGGIVVGGLWGVCVIFGAHRALLPIGLNDVAISGTNTLMCFAGAATISAFLVGITEPVIYGCNLRLKKPILTIMSYYGEGN